MATISPLNTITGRCAIGSPSEISISSAISNGGLAGRPVLVESALPTITPSGSPSRTVAMSGRPTALRTSIFSTKSIRPWSSGAPFTFTVAEAIVSAATGVMRRGGAG